MLRRRTIVSAGSVLVASSLAGCLDEFVDDESGRETFDVSNETTVPSEADDEEDEAPTTYPKDDESESYDELSTDAEILHRYADSIRNANEAQSAITASFEAHADDEYERASERASDGSIFATAANELLSSAISLTDELDRPDAREILEEGNEYNTQLHEAAHLSRQAATAGRRGDSERAREQRRDAEERVRVAARAVPRGTDDLREALEME